MGVRRGEQAQCFSVSLVKVHRETSSYDNDSVRTTANPLRGNGTELT